jgi:hypothetical protein
MLIQPFFIHLLEQSVAYTAPAPKGDYFILIYLLVRIAYRKLDFCSAIENVQVIEVVSTNFRICGRSFWLWFPFIDN